MLSPEIIKKIKKVHIIGIGGIGVSKIHETFPKWMGWYDFVQLALNGTWTTVDIRAEEYVEFQSDIYRSPEIADLYLTHIEKASVSKAYFWEPEQHYYEKITNQLAKELIFEITNNYAKHIMIVRDKPVYIYNPNIENSWVYLDHFSGYSYQWSNYFLDDQGSSHDLYQYRYENSPLRITGFRTFQGAGDIRGLMNVYQVLSHAFSFDIALHEPEKAAFYLLEEILRSQRVDGSFAFSPYFGTSIPTEVFPDPLFNDVKIRFHLRKASINCLGDISSIGPPANGQWVECPFASGHGRSLFPGPL